MSAENEAVSKWFSDIAVLFASNKTKSELLNSLVNLTALFFKLSYAMVCYKETTAMGYQKVLSLKDSSKKNDYFIEQLNANNLHFNPSDTGIKKI
ncbi:MAG: hypothetical protein PF447_05470, partial [Spirochaetaceae bacterium]|nr:hypothetical protein [Spirochaetaceae bacterium]